MCVCVCVSVCVCESVGFVVAVADVLCCRFHCRNINPENKQRKETEPAERVDLFSNFLLCTKCCDKPVAL